MLTRFLAIQIRPYRRLLLLASFLNVIGIMSVLYLPSLNAQIINEGVIKGDLGFILHTGTVMVVVSMIQVVSQIAATFYSTRVASAIGRDLRSKVFRRVQDFSERDVGQFGTSSLITRSVNDVDQVQLLALSIFEVAAPAPMMCIGAMAMAASLDVPTSTLLLGVMVVIAVAVMLILKQMHPLYTRMQRRIDRINHVLREQITGVQVVRAFIADDREHRRFSEQNRDLRTISHRVGLMIAAIPPVIMLTTNVFSVILLWLGAGRVDEGKMDPGTLSALLSYMGLSVMSITMAMVMLINVPRAKVSAARIQEVLDTATSVPVPSKAVNESITAGSIEMRSVTFSYPGAQEPVLGDIDLVVKPGQTVGVLGSTGSGKTTLLNLVIRLFDATGGAVLVNGVDVRLMDPETLPRTVALVPQTPYLFSGTIESNLRFGRPDCSERALWHALEIVQAREFVEALPDGLKTPTNQGGTELSGGQRQRLAIARALICQADIYLFDDSFSALDFATEAAVQRALAEELSSATLLMVAQRVATVRTADHVIVLDEGRVVGAGTHADLIQSNPTYREIAQSQLAGMGVLA
ncbi:MAG: ATP-binding cassette, subfamily multidrug efflux pump [Actinoplanes sp.]|jgi:ATP-binding cassette subfamily B protein|nr:ATP-binding cassette, subfamily multidrug efflux pump [Actinoplanes sp.]